MHKTITSKDFYLHFLSAIFLKRHTRFNKKYQCAIFSAKHVAKRFHHFSTPSKSEFEYNAYFIQLFRISINIFDPL